MQSKSGQIAGLILRNQLDDNELRATPPRVKDARRMALEGYRELFEDWLPFYRSFGQRPQDDTAEILTLLRIMTTLDDTCVIKRVGYEKAQEVKREAEEILRCAQNDRQNDKQNERQNERQDDGAEAFVPALKELCGRYEAEGISPGGAADMLALTIFIDTLIL